MLRKASTSLAIALAFNLLLLLPLAFAIHAQSHTHTVYDSSENQWYDNDTSECQLCVHYAHQALDITTFTFFFTPRTGWKYTFFLPEYTFTSSIDVHHLRGPPVIISA